MDSQKIYDHVRAHYSAAAQGTTAEYASVVAKSFGYSEKELATVPEGSNLGLSCGNPLAIASITEGETIIDLGSGAGFDAFLASDRAGPSGKVIGVDMNENMLSKANRIKTQTGRTNVEFVQSGITDISILQSETADCIISNCVINLVPAEEKNLVFREIFRLLKPGGRLVVSDILAKKQLPETLRADMAMYVGCISGACTVGEYEELLKDAGLSEILISDTKSDLNVYFQTNEDGSRKMDGCIPPIAKEAEAETGCGSFSELRCVSGPTPACCVTNCPARKDTDVSLTENNLNEWVGSFRIYAVKN